MGKDERPSPQATPTEEPPAAAATAAAKAEEELPSLRVAMTLVFLLAFSLSFATMSEFYVFAKQSADAEISGPFSCALAYGEEANHTAYCPLNATQLCAIVTASLVGEAANDTRQFVVYQLFQDFFDHSECSYAYCTNEIATAKSTYGTKLRTWQLAALRRRSANATIAPCWLDATKPDRAFLELEDFDHGKLFFSKAAAYVILVLPPVALAVSLLAVLVCLIIGKLTAAEVRLPADAQAA